LNPVARGIVEDRTAIRGRAFVSFADLHPANGKVPAPTLRQKDAGLPGNRRRFVEMPFRQDFVIKRFIDRSIGALLNVIDEEPVACQRRVL
jgi:hypothetical protein